MDFRASLFTVQCSSEGWKEIAVSATGITIPGCAVEKDKKEEKKLNMIILSLSDA